MKRLFVFFSSLILPAVMTNAQTTWPQVLKTPMGAIIKLYQPQPDSFAGNDLWYHAAFSYLENGKAAPEFGSYEADAKVETDRDERIVEIDTVAIGQLDLPGIDPAALRKLRPLLERGISDLEARLSLDALLSSLNMTTAARNLSQGLNNQPPRIIYADRPSILVTIDGDPHIQRNRELGMDVVINTPFIIMKHLNSWYLYGGRHWYAASGPTGPYSYTAVIPKDMAGAQMAVEMADSLSGTHSDTAREGADVIADIIVTTVPAELIQTAGETAYAPIPGTQLLYVVNSNNNIFVHTGTQAFYLLLSGRWYKAPGLQGGWEYVAADSLPADFARIPEGSPKDNVLASVAGTAAAREAVIDAQVPQTTAIDRKLATTQVVYDGEPRFAGIRGTELQYAVNTPSVVLIYRNRYYCADNGVWFVAGGPTGPWIVADTRPADVDLIPPDYPVYACKYLYIFEATPDYIYMGYTPGYLDNFIYGPTVVYGTGYYYQPWWGSVFYPRPWTWGFNMWYDPWYGWALGFDFGPDWFNFGFQWGWVPWVGGWWGPRIYRPPYVWHHFRGHGLYDRNVQHVANVENHNNLYGFRHDLATRPANEQIYSDRDGKIYRRSSGGGWEQRDGNRWKSLDMQSPKVIDRLNRQEQQRSRGEMRIKNFQQMRGGGLPGAGRPAGAPPAMRPAARPARH
ncbi:MAG TPA: hypothetical protein VMH27_23120 [Puia sp.]|nr:hypothetical protein [Puia sp.]